MGGSGRSSGRSGRHSSRKTGSVDSAPAEPPAAHLSEYGFLGAVGHNREGGQQLDDLLQAGYRTRGQLCLQRMMPPAAAVGLHPGLYDPHKVVAMRREVLKMRHRKMQAGAAASSGGDASGASGAAAPAEAAAPTATLHEHSNERRGHAYAGVGHGLAPADAGSHAERNDGAHQQSSEDEYEDDDERAEATVNEVMKSGYALPSVTAPGKGYNGITPDRPALRIPRRVGADGLPLRPGQDTIQQNTPEQTAQAYCEALRLLRLFRRRPPPFGLPNFDAFYSIFPVNELEVPDAVANLVASDPSGAHAFALEDDDPDYEEEAEETAEDVHSMHSHSFPSGDRAQGHPLHGVGEPRFVVRRHDGAVFANTIVLRSWPLREGYLGRGEGCSINLELEASQHVGPKHAIIRWDAEQGVFQLQHNGAFLGPSLTAQLMHLLRGNPHMSTYLRSTTSLDAGGGLGTSSLRSSLERSTPEASAVTLPEAPVAAPALKTQGRSNTDDSAASYQGSRRRHNSAMHLAADSAPSVDSAVEDEDAPATPVGMPQFNASGFSQSGIDNATHSTPSGDDERIGPSLTLANTIGVLATAAEEGPRGRARAPGTPTTPHDDEDTSQTEKSSQRSTSDADEKGSEGAHNRSFTGPIAQRTAAQVTFDFARHLLAASDYLSYLVLSSEMVCRDRYPLRKGDVFILGKDAVLVVTHTVPREDASMEKGKDRAARMHGQAAAPAAVERTEEKDVTPHSNTSSSSSSSSSPSSSSSEGEAATVAATAASDAGQGSGGRRVRFTLPGPEELDLTGRHRITAQYKEELAGREEGVVPTAAAAADAAAAAAGSGLHGPKPPGPGVRGGSGTSTGRDDRETANALVGAMNSALTVRVVYFRRSEGGEQEDPFTSSSFGLGLTSASGVPDRDDANLVTGEYFVRHTVTIGSGTSNTIRVHAEGVAPVHARIEFDQGICWLRDLSLGSDYGTRVVLTRPVSIHAGDILLFGRDPYFVAPVYDCPDFYQQWNDLALRVTPLRKSKRKQLYPPTSGHFQSMHVVIRDQQVTVGRARKCVLRVRDYQLNRMHAVVYREEGRYHMSSLIHTRNKGTFVLLGRAPPRDPVLAMRWQYQAKGPYELMVGDSFSVGSTVFTVEDVKTEDEDALARRQKRDLAQVASMWRDVPIFSNLDTRIVNEIQPNLKPMSFNAGQCIVRQGTQGHHFYIVKRGHVRVVYEGKGAGRASSGGIRVGARAEGGGGEEDEEDVEDITESGHLSKVEPYGGADSHDRERSAEELEQRARVEALAQLQRQREQGGKSTEGDGEDDFDAGRPSSRPDSRPAEAAPAGSQLSQSLMTGSVLGHGPEGRGSVGDQLAAAMGGGGGGSLAPSGREGATSDTGPKELARLGPGQYFGEIALFRNQSHSASVFADGDVEVLMLDRATFLHVMGPMQEAMNAEIVKRELRGAQDMIDSFPLLSRLDATTKRTLARSLREARFKAGERLYEPGRSYMADVRRFYLIVRGSVRAVKRLRPSALARKGRRRRRKQKRQQQQLKNMRWRQHRDRLQRGPTGGEGAESPGGTAGPSPMAQAMDAVHEGAEEEDAGEEVFRLGEGDYVGEDSLLRRSRALSEAVALEDTLCMYLTEDDFRECLKPLFEDLRQLTRAQERTTRRGTMQARPSMYQMKGKGGSGFGARHIASLQRRQSSLRHPVDGESDEEEDDLSVEGEEMEVMGRLSTPRPGLTEGGAAGSDEAEEDLKYGQMGSGSQGGILLASSKAGELPTGSAGGGHSASAGTAAPGSGAASVDDRLEAEEDLAAVEARKANLSHFIQLRAVSGPLRRQVFLADTDFVTIGRRGSSIEINDRALSQLHCMIEYRDGSYWLSDMDSHHGTFLKLNKNVEYTLDIGDVLHLGSSEFMVLARTQTRPRHPLAPSSLLFEIASVYAQHPYSGVQQPDTGETGELDDDDAGKPHGPPATAAVSGAMEAQHAGGAVTTAGSAYGSAEEPVEHRRRRRRPSRESVDSSNSVGGGGVVDTSSMPAPAGPGTSTTGTSAGAAGDRRDQARVAPMGPRQSPQAAYDPGAKVAHAAAEEERPQSESSGKASRGVRSHRVVPVGPDGRVPEGASKDKDNCVLQ